MALGGSPVTFKTRWVAYLSDESGREEVFVQSFPALVRKTRKPLEWPAPELMDSAKNCAGLFESADAADPERRILIGAVEAGDPWLLEHQPVDSEARVQPVEVLHAEALPS